MPDWIGGDAAATSCRYRHMAREQLHGISPSYEAICLGVAEDEQMLTALDELPPTKRQPNLLLGAVRFLDGPVASWPQFRDFAHDRWDEIAAVMTARRTQTNEVRRCATLLPILAALPAPLALFEVGASAGLCLFPDRYRYRYTRPDGGEHVVGEGPVLSCTVTGPAPLPGSLPIVGWRGGLDLNPLDVRDDEDVRWLRCLIWPEQTERFVLLDDAVAIARAEPPQLHRGDLRDDLGPALAAVPPAATLVVFHSAVLAYVGDAERQQFFAAMRELARERQVCWVSNEAPGIVPGTDLPSAGPARFVLARDGQVLGRTGPHGHTLDWAG